MEIAAVVLAAGQGSCLRSDMPKGMFPLAGQPLVHYAVAAATALTQAPPVLVVSDDSDQVRAVLGDSARPVAQAERLGAGHAVLQARDLLVGQADVVLVIDADMPLLTSRTLQRLVDAHVQSQCVLTLFTVVTERPSGFGRVLRQADGRIKAVVEEPDCSPEQLASRELNAGVYCFKADWLWENLPRLPRNPKGEFCLTDMIGMAADQGSSVNAVVCDVPGELLTINTRVHLAEAERVLRDRINRFWMEAGVTLMDPASTYIDTGVTIGQDTTILPGTYLLGATVIGRQCRIGPNTLIEGTQIGDRCTVRMSVLEYAVMEEDADIGPFGHLRRGARVCRGAHMGNFGELKNSTLGPNSMMGHFSYLGDAQVGANVNIGAGTITCNYDGTRKHPTIIEDGAFIGSDSMLVAPLFIGRGAKTGAGSVVTHDVPAGAVVYGVPARSKRLPGEASAEPEKE